MNKGTHGFGRANIPDAVGARVHYAAGTQTAVASPGTALLFDTEVFDSDDFHSTVTNTSRLTVPSGKAGKYLIGGGFHVGNNADIQIRLNGVTIIAFGRAGVGASTIVGYSVDTVYPLADGDYVELMAVGQGASRTVNQDGVVSPHFWMILIGK